MKAPKTIEVLKEHRDLSVLSVGSVGAGKSSVLCCLTGRSLASITDRNLDDEVLQRAVFVRDHGKLTVSDCQGFRGDLKHDWLLLRKTLSQLPAEEPIDLVALCLSTACITDTKNDQVNNILFLLKEFTTADFRRLIHVIISYAPEHMVDDALRDIIAKKFSFLGDGSREEVLKKVTFVDLVNPLNFDESLQETQKAIEGKWAEAQRQLDQLVASCDPNQSIRPNQILSSRFFYQFCLVYKHELCFAVLSLTILVLLLVIFFHHLSTADKVMQLDTCLNDMQSLAKANELLKVKLENLPSTCIPPPPPAPSPSAGFWDYLFRAFKVMF
eukprot:gene5342-5878_t